jgi:hypothetical protein
VLKASPFVGEGCRKVWARLRFRGIRTSKDRVRRLMRAHSLQGHHHRRRTHGNKAHDGRITTDTPRQRRPAAVQGDYHGWLVAKHGPVEARNHLTGLAAA